MRLKNLLKKVLDILTSSSYVLKCVWEYDYYADENYGEDVITYSLYKKADDRWICDIYRIRGPWESEWPKGLTEQNAVKIVKSQVLIHSLEAVGKLWVCKDILNNVLYYKELADTLPETIKTQALIWR